VKTLIDAGAAVNPQISNSIPPLVFAKRYNHSKVVTLLLQNGAMDTDSPIIPSLAVSLKSTRDDDFGDLPSPKTPSSLQSSSQLADEDISSLIKTNPLPGNLSNRSLKYRTSPAPPPRANNTPKPYVPTLASTLNENRSPESQPKKRNISHTLHLVIDED